MVEYMAARHRQNDTRRTIARNLRALLDMRKWSEHDLAKASGVAQKTINNVLAARSACTVDTVGALARPFGLTSWHMLIEDLPADLTGSPSIRQLVASWISATPEGREHIELVAAREAKIGRK